MKKLKDIGIVPASSRAIEELFPQIVGKNRKLHQLENEQKLIRLRRGLYLLSPEISEKTISTELIANHLCTPSYVSMHSALRYYGLIPEAIFRVQSVTLKAACQYENSFGIFSFTHVSREVFSVGITTKSSGECSFLIATPEKALCDLIADSPYLNLRYLSDVQHFLVDDLRFDMEKFWQMDLQIFENYAQVGKKKNSIKMLMKFLKNGK